MIPNEEKQGWYYLAVKNYLHYYMKFQKLQNIRTIFIVYNAFILFEQKIKLNLMKNYVEIKIFEEL